MLHTSHGILFPIYTFGVSCTVTVIIQVVLSVLCSQIYLLNASAIYQVYPSNISSIFQIYLSHTTSDTLRYIKSKVYLMYFTDFS